MAWPRHIHELDLIGMQLTSAAHFKLIKFIRTRFITLDTEHIYIFIIIIILPMKSG
jgi:hypothetical protein